MVVLLDQGGSMMRSVVSALALMGALWAPPALAQTADELRAELSEVESELAEAEAEAARYGDGLLRLLAQGRHEALLLTQAILEGRIEAAESGAPMTVVVPVLEPDEERAAAILAEMEAAEARVAEAEAEAARYSGGLIQGLALSTAQSERLALSQLRMGYLQAKYGIVFPAGGAFPDLNVAGGAPDDQAAESAAGTSPAPVATEPEPSMGPEWADTSHPEIEYDSLVFANAHHDGQRLAGWWGIKDEQSPLDDSPTIIAINYSAQDERSFASDPLLAARCIEGQTSMVLRVNDFLLDDSDSNTMQVTVRVDDKPARQTRWRTMTDNQGVGIMDADAEALLAELQGAASVFLRLTERDGQQHDALFNLAGSEVAFQAVAEACGPLGATAQDDDGGDAACAGLATQADISECATGRHQESERMLTTAYQLAIAAQGGDDEPLRVSQRAWIVRREADCEAERAVFDGGSGEGSALGLCLARWNEARTVGLLQVNEGAVAVGGLDAYDAPGDD